jgi:L,D-peptidoglycan transpeptidase YkuD (ErfK/YbiS/YcfS/YnhG family)
MIAAAVVIGLLVFAGRAVLGVSAATTKPNIANASTRVPLLEPGATRFMANRGRALIPVTFAPTTVASTTTAPAPATTATRPPPTTAVPTTLTAASPCPAYSAATYGIDPNQVPDTGGGTQLVTVVDSTGTSLDGTFVAWAKNAHGCWSPVSFAGQPAQPYQAQTGYGGLLPISQRVPGDGATPIGLFPFGTTVYGNSIVSPTSLYPYHHLVCGDWWDEQPGSPTYETFQHVSCGTTPPYGSDSEALWTETQPYQHFIDIMMPHPPDNGAGIFLHDDTTDGYTAGCVALPNAELDAVLGWLNPADSPHVLITVA